MKEAVWTSFILCEKIPNKNEKKFEFANMDLTNSDFKDFSRYGVGLLNVRKFLTSSRCKG